MIPPGCSSLSSLGAGYLYLRLTFGFGGGFAIMCLNFLSFAFGGHGHKMTISQRMSVIVQVEVFRPRNSSF
jgi:hypothetical protein